MRDSVVLILLALALPALAQGSGGGGGGGSRSRSSGSGGSCGGPECYVPLAGGFALFGLAYVYIKRRLLLRKAANERQHTANMAAETAQAEKDGCFYVPRNQAREWAGWIQGSADSAVNADRIETRVTLTFQCPFTQDTDISTYTPRNGAVIGQGFDTWGEYEIAGEWDDNTSKITWSKTYKTVNNVKKRQVKLPVNCVGFFDGRKIHGVWSINDQVFEQGTFELTMPEGLVSRPVNNAAKEAKVDIDVTSNQVMPAPVVNSTAPVVTTTLMMPQPNSQPVYQYGAVGYAPPSYAQGVGPDGQPVSVIIVQQQPAADMPAPPPPSYDAAMYR